jgi:hypothetical protein
MKDKRSISMAANKWTKWMVGLSSVAAFTTFIGLSQKYDQTNSTATALNNDTSADNSSQTQTEDETDLFPDSGSDSNMDKINGQMTVLMSKVINGQTIIQAVKMISGQTMIQVISKISGLMMIPEIVRIIGAITMILLSNQDLLKDVM